MLTSKAQRIDVTDHFEEPGLSSIWGTSRMEAHSFKIQSQIVRKGSSAAMITLRTGDVVEVGNDSSKESERDELEEKENLYSLEGLEYEYRFSMFLPDTFPIVPVRLVLAQWKQKCPVFRCSDDGPIIAIRYRSGKLSITLQTGAKRKALWELNEEIRNRWLDFRFIIKFSRKEDGKLAVFLNDKNIIDYKGITSYSSDRGYADKSLYYFKMGLYRDRIPQPMTIWIDEYSKKLIR